MRVALNAFLLIYAATCMCVAQEQVAPKTGHPGISDTKIDEYGNIPWRDEKRRLGWLVNQMESASGSIIYLNFYDGRNGCAGEARRRAARAKNYLIRVRDVRPERLNWKYGGHREELTVEAWVLPPPEQAPSATPTVDPREAKLRACGRSGRRKRA